MFCLFYCFIILSIYLIKNELSYLISKPKIYNKIETVTLQTKNTCLLANKLSTAFRCK